MDSRISQTTPRLGRREIYTVSGLTHVLRALLEKEFPMVWITGEISNLRIPSSGHAYFTLKDDKARVDAVLFRNQFQRLQFRPEDGMKITAMGRISVYPPRGNYQIILEYMEPAGAGALRAAFEQTKKRLAAEGIFDEDRKKKIPFLPEKIGLITSPGGAVVQDMLRVIHRRFPGMPVQIAPVRVQGEGAEEEIIRALSLFNERAGEPAGVDVILLARGGGSVEDLHAFNSEWTARAIYASVIPVISGVGHETDVTIADFAADLRAATPSVAAELAVPEKADLDYTLSILRSRLHRVMGEAVSRRRRRLDEIRRRLPSPFRHLPDRRQRLDELSTRLHRAVQRMPEDAGIRRRRLLDRLRLAGPGPKFLAHRHETESLTRRLAMAMENIHRTRRHRIHTLTEILRAMDPAALLRRGYSIVRLPDGRIVTRAAALRPGDDLDIRFASGRTRAQVRRVFPEIDPDAAVSR